MPLPTAEEVIQAYQETGMKPINATFGPWEGRCCALGVIAHQKNLLGYEAARIFLGVPPETVRAFTFGFDDAFSGNAPGGPNGYSTEDYKAGRAVGEAVRKAFPGEESARAPDE